LDLGDTAFEKDDYAGARKAYESARKADEKHPGGETGIARTAIAMLNLPTDYAVAKGNAKLLAVATSLDAICKKFEDYGPAWVEAGRAKLLLGDAPGALTALREGYRLLPNEPEAASALGVALLATGDAPGAEKYLSRARDLDPGSAARHGNLGTLFFLLGRVPDAIGEYDSAARIAPNDAKSHADLGTALLASGDFRRAELELGKAIAQEPKRASFKNNLGYAYQSQGKLAAAKAEYDAALALDPKLASAWINLATLLAKSPATRGDARKALLKAQALDATDPRVKANLEELDALEKGHATP
jgi:Flp pilus assembly protein TadD